MNPEELTKELLTLLGFAYGAALAFLSLFAARLYWKNKNNK
jgi:hypothetical protein